MRFYTLDLMRFFAALAVVLYHYTARPESNSFEVLSGFTKFGYLGVPLFFIISGFVICASAQNRTAMEFAVSRFVRLYPAYWLGIAITVTTVIWLGAGEITLIQVLANLTMLNDYVGISDVDGVFWTLQAELKFYGCIFLLSVFGVFPKFKVWLTIWMAITVSYLVFAQPFFMGWFISPSYSSLFIAGVLFYLIGQQGLRLALLLVAGLLTSGFLSLRVSAARRFCQHTRPHRSMDSDRTHMGFLSPVCPYDCRQVVDKGQHNNSGIGRHDLSALPDSQSCRKSSHGLRAEKIAA